MAEIEFWFDFTSPYAYFGSLQVEEVAARHGRSVRWRPFLLGAVFKETGMQAQTRIPLRGDYARHDWARLARRLGVPFRLPPDHPSVTVAAGRAFYHLEDAAPDLAVPFAKRVFQVHLGEGVDIGPAERVVGIAQACGADGPTVAEAIRSDALRERLRAVTDEALRRGIFGAPYFIVDGEPFWGADRLDMVDDWLARGGW